MFALRVIVLIIFYGYTIQTAGITQRSLSSLNYLVSNITNATNISDRPSKTEIILRHVFLLMCQRAPRMDERSRYYNYLKSGELSQFDLAAILLKTCGNELSNNLNKSTALFGTAVTINVSSWEHRMGNKIYSWTVDFHGSPAACNMPIYTDIDVVLHPEIDHRPNCEFFGLCKERLKGFGLGGYMAGFALDPDHQVLLIYMCMIT